MSGAGRPPARAAGERPAAAPPRPLDDAELERLQALLEAVPAPLEPLDATMLDGFLCGVLVQPRPVPESAWFPHVLDAESGRPARPGYDAAPLRALVRRRHAELDAAIEARRWFDPWVFEPEADDEAPGPTRAPAADDGLAGLAGLADEDGSEAHGADGAPPEVQAVYPWVAGCVTALDLFPGVMALTGPALDEALVLLYRHLDPEDLEDADAILETIETLEPAEDLATAVEELVRATLLLADIGRPQRRPPAAPATARRRPRPGRPPR